jgi:hypothetical protein
MGGLAEVGAKALTRLALPALPPLPTLPAPALRTHNLDTCSTLRPRAHAYWLWLTSSCPRS